MGNSWIRRLFCPFSPSPSTDPSPLAEITINCACFHSKLQQQDETDDGGCEEEDEPF